MRGLRKKIHRVLTLMLALGCLTPLAACNAENDPKGIFMKKQVVLDVVLFSYLDRPIFDVYLNKTDIGVAGRYGGGRGTMTGVTIPFGPQTLTWRDAGSGKTSTIRTPLSLSPEQIPPETHYLGVHIYPDDTAEFTFAQYMPDPSDRGEQIYKEHHLYGR